MPYLDPKNDLTFKKVFGQHPHLLKSFLNAMLPLEEDQVIESLEYLPIELVPDIILFKNTIVDVRCKDNKGRQFIVEMQMNWTSSFRQRVLFNASKAYIKQLDKNEEYTLLNPVYALSLVNDIYEPEMKSFYHHYKIVHIENIDKQIEGLEFIFIELPKFKPQNISEKKLQVLWLRYLTEIKDGSIEISSDFYDNPDTKEAVDYLQESAFSKAELEYYDKYWDIVASEKTVIKDSEKKGEIKGEIKGRIEGKIEGIIEGKIEVARIMKQNNEDINKIVKFTGLSKEEIEKL